MASSNLRASGITGKFGGKLRLSASLLLKISEIVREAWCVFGRPEPLNLRIELAAVIGRNSVIFEELMAAWLFKGNSIIVRGVIGLLSQFTQQVGSI